MEDRFEDYFEHVEHDSQEAEFEYDGFDLYDDNDKYVEY